MFTPHPPALTAIICTYNPNRDRLSRTIDSLAAQLLRIPVIVVDNRSSPPLAIEEISRDGLDVTLVMESKPGLTPARIRGFHECPSDLLVYVDDDNVLAPDFSQNALLLAEKHPDIGVFSSSISGDFEIQPEAWMRPYLPYLALNSLETSKFSHLCSGGTMPIGAGMVVRRQVMEHYAETAGGDQMRSAMDRDGISLLAGGDTDIGYAALEIGLGCGLCKELRVEHLIPKERLCPSYLWKLMADVTASHKFLQLIHGGSTSSFVKRMKWLIAGYSLRILPNRSHLKSRSALAYGKWKGEEMYSRTKSPSRKL